MLRKQVTSLVVSFVLPVVLMGFTPTVVSAQNAARSVAVRCADEQRINGQSSKTTPAIAWFDGKLHMVHQGDRSNELYHSVFDGRQWSPNVKIGLTSDDAPALAVLDGRLHMAYLGLDGEIYHSEYDGEGWSSASATGQKSDAGPALVVFNSELIMVRTGTRDNSLYQSKWDANTGTWKRAVNTGQKSDAVPALAVGDDLIMMTRLGVNTNVLYWSTQKNDKDRGWSKAQRISNQLSKNHPGLASFADRFFMVHTGDRSNNIYMAVYDGGWGGEIKIGGASKASPAIAAGEDALHVVYIGATLNNIYHRICLP